MPEPPAAGWRRYPIPYHRSGAQPARGDRHHRRIVQISDTHLSHRRAYAVPNVEAVLDWIEADPPDLVVHTGDITADDPDDAEEADFARQLLLGRGLPLVVLPGNHDVGGFSGDLVDDRRIDGVPGSVGIGLLDGRAPPWRLVGANVYRLDRADHLGWLRDALATDEPITLFLHQPICLVRPDLADEGDWSLADGRRVPRCSDAMRDRPVRVVASGHLHRYRAGTLPGGIDAVWAPAASFVGTERDDGSTYRVGAVEHLLAADGTATHRLIEPPAYPPLAFEDFAPAGAEGLRDAPLLPLATLDSVPPVRPRT